MTRARAIVLSLLIVGVVPTVWTLPSLVAAVLTAPSLLILPIGLGLLTTYGIPGRRPVSLSTLQLLLISYFVGLFLVVLLFVSVERYLVEPIAPAALMAAIWVLALLGWLRVDAFEVNSGNKRLVVFTVLLVIVITAIRYSYTITIFSEFPITDLFQRIQFHGGAWEFAKTGILNPFVAGSYIPVQQLQLGLLLRLTGADPLVAEWVWPVAFAPIQAAAIYVFCSRIMQQRRAAAVAFCLALAQFGLSNPTNGTLAELATITILSLLLNDGDGRSSQLSATAARLLALIVGIACGLALQKVPVAFCVFGALAIILPTGIFSLDRRWSVLVAITLLTAITLPLHRGALLYFLLAGFAATTFNIMLILQKQTGSRFQRTPIWLLAILALVLVAMAMRILLLREGGADAFGLWKIFDLVLMPLAGKSLAVVAIDGDLAPGAGARVALFELARAVSPLVAGIAVGGVILLMPPVGRHRLAFAETMAGRKALAQALVVLGLSCLILTGFPFIYRASFILIVFASTGAINVLQTIPRALRAQRLSYLAFFAYASLIAVLTVVAARAEVQPYLERAGPVFLVLAILFAVLLASQRVFPSVDGRWIGVLFVLTVTTEVALSRTYFKPYAFHAQTPPASGSFASFDQNDLAFADYLDKTVDRSAILVSDPKTMTFIRGRTGVLPLVSSSNLDTIDVANKTALTSVLRGLVLNEGSIDPCTAINAILDGRASGIYDYDNYRTQTGAVDGRSVLSRLGYDDRLVPQFRAHQEQRAEPARIVPDKHTQNFAIVVNNTTIDWLRHPSELSYFPVGGPLPEDVVANLTRYTGDAHLFGNSYVAKLKCKQNRT